MTGEETRDRSGEGRLDRAAEAITQIGRVLAQSPRPSEASQRIAESVRTLLGARAVGICRLRPETGEHIGVAVAGAVGPALSRNPLFAHDVGTLGRAVREGGPVATTDVLADPSITLTPRVREGLAEARCQALLTLPLRARDRVVGTLTVCDEAGRVYDEEDVRLASAFADLAALVLENARLFRESDRRRRTAEALVEIGRFLALTLDPEEVARRIAESLRSLLRVRIACVWRLEPSGDLALIAVAGDDCGPFEPGLVRPAGVGVVGLAVKERRPVSTPNFTTDARLSYPADSRREIEGTVHRSALAVPLVVSGRVIGALGAGAREGRVFRDAEVRLAESLASHAAAALDNARLHAETGRERQEAEAIEELARTLNRSLDLDTTLERVVAAANGLCASDAARIHLRDPETGAMVPRYRAGLPPLVRVAVAVEPGKGLGGLVLATGRPVRTEDYAGDPRFTKDYLTTVAPEGLGMVVMAVPIHGDERIEGLLYVYRRARRPFTDRDEAALVRLGSHAALAIRNAQLFAREQRAHDQAEASGQRFHDLVQSLEAVVWEATLPPAGAKDANPRPFTFVSRQAEVLLGYPMERWLFDPDFWPSIVHPADRDRLVAACRAAAAEGRDAEVEYRLVAADGRIVWVRDLVRFVHGTGGAVPLRRGVMVDVTARRQHEARQATQSAVATILAESPSLGEAMARLLQAIGGGMGWDAGEYWAVDGEGGALAWAAAWHAPALDTSALEAISRRTTFAPGRGLPGRAWAGQKSLWVADVLGDAAFLRADAAREAGLHGAVAVPVLARDRVTGVMVFFAREVVPLDVGLLAFMHDLGTQIGQLIERQQADEERARLISIVEQTDETIVMTTPDRKIVYVNPAFERSSGYAAAEAIGRTPRLLRSGEHPEEFYESLRRAIARGDVWRGEIVNRRKDGTLYTVELSIAPVRNERGEITNYVSIGQDVSARKALEAQLRQSAKMEAVGRLAGGVAHDFNNLLTLILSYSNLLTSGLPAGTPLHRYADTVETTAERAATLTRQLLTFSRKQVVNPRVLDLNATVEATSRMLQRLIGEDIDLRARLGHGLWRVKADPGQLEQVLMNLAVNARDAMPRGGRLTIETANVELGGGEAQPGPGRWVMLAVTDTGSGMDADTLSHIFEPFFTTKGPGEGSGLGLSTVFGIVTQSGGDIRVESEPGRGTTFQIYLPEAVGDLERPAPTPASAAAPSGSETILLVEDAEDLRAMAVEVLRGKGYRVLEAQDGAEALRVAQEHRRPIHLLLSDVVMPGMTGPELAEQLLKTRPGLRLLFMSGYPASARDVLQASRSPLLEKPFTPAVLARRVREVLDVGRR